MTGFRPVPGFPGYLISEAGQIYSQKSKKFLPWNFNKTFYVRVQLFDKNQGGRRQLFVHRLVAMVFKKNPDPKKFVEVNHLDYNTMNPHASNLEWCTPEQNRKHARKKMYVNFNTIDERKFIPAYSGLVPF